MPKPHCYMCDSRATSREHVPPRALFPEANESGGVDYRTNLITVPSCDAHNSAKSKDDEFLMLSLAGIFGSNPIGHMHRRGKVDRAVLGNDQLLIDRVLVKKEEVHRIETTENQFFDLVWGTPDIERLNRCFEHIAYGLHRHHFKRNFRGSVRVLPGYLREKDHNKRKFIELIRDRAELDLVAKPKLGSNSDVFFYQTTDPDQFGLYLMRLCFYGGLTVYAAFTPEGSTPPPNLTALLIDRGIPTVLTLGNHKYEFNPPGED